MALWKRGKSWQIDYNHNGRRIRESAGPDKEEARILLAERLKDIRQGRDPTLHTGHPENSIVRCRTRGAPMKRKETERAKVFSVRLTPAEWRRLQAAARAAYLPLSAYVRQRLFGEPKGKPVKGGRETAR